jgi:hypothetical protein
MTGLAGLFHEAFGDGPDVFRSASFLEWKYFDPRADWQRPRSYVTTQKGRVAAHACIWPLSIRTPGGPVTSSHLIDWAAHADSGGAGAILYRHLLQMTDTVIAIGGSDQARRVLPRLGFAPCGEVSLYSVVVRPMRQFAQRQDGSLLKNAAKTVRNSMWPGVPATRPNWSSAFTSDPDAAFEPLRAMPFHAEWRATERCPDAIRYLLQCPAAECSLHTLTVEGAAAGYFILNQIGGQCRIIDLMVASDAADDWQAAYTEAARVAAERPDTCEVVAVSSVPWLSAILERANFRLQERRPMMLFDPRGRLAFEPSLSVQMVDWDAYFLYDPSFPFLT